ncbi:MAG: PAS domain S-box protein [Alphaproteobacteria bacterium]|nr:PAS domain S-box protein [Alphaproteobacteria bacterium]MBT4965811.1 PAS domain S-box protein [Alphaproteobacteria bacterium]MBT5158959.1 PAS domain S-box protein [Alphaproteobacteria bacterium]MBT6385126.1 PAS domain S-box protein [Alphaproteobacteria bacterium]
MAGLLDRSGVHIWQVDEAQKFQFCSPGFLTLFDVAADDVQGKSLEDLDWQPCDEENWTTVLARCREGQKSVDLKVDITGPDGGNRQYAVCLQPLLNESKAVAGLVGTCQLEPASLSPATDKDAELERWRDLANSGADWFWEFDSDLRVSYLSESQEETTGIPNANFIGRERSDFTGADFDVEAMAQHRADLAAHRAFKDFTYPNHTPDGSLRWIRTSGTPYFDRAGKFAGYRGTGRDFTKEQEALLASRRSEQQILDALELVPMGISLWDENERFIVANSGMNQYLPVDIEMPLVPGVKLEDFSHAAANKGFISKASEGDDDWFEARLLRLREASGEPFENFRADGSWVRLTVSRLASGGILISSIDITELKQREKELDQARTQLTDALESIDLGFSIYDAEDRLVLVNSAFRSMFQGMEHFLVPGTKFEDVARAGAIANNMEDVEGFVARRIEMRKGQEIPRTIETRPGVWKYINESKSQNGGTVTVWTDVSQIKEQEQALRETESRFSIAFHSSPLLMSISRLSDGGYVEVNDKFMEMTGYSREELLANGGTEVSVMEDEQTDSKIRSKLMRGQEIDDMEIVMSHKNGELFEVLISGDIVEVAGEQSILIIGLDFSSHKRLENSLITAKNEAEFANRTKSEFLANMSHELRTPLNAVIGFSEFLANETFGPLGDARYKEYIGDIRDSGTHLLNLINEILDVAKVEAGKMELRENEVDLDDMVLRGIRSVEGRANKSGLIISGTVAPGLPFLRCDETKFRQILINVLNNAVKFTDAGGKIEVFAGLNDDGEMEIQVKDTGIGIAAEDMDAVFRVFGQAESAQDRRFEGAGLGLPLTKALVELHGGDFRLESELGVGTTVFITFPKDRLVNQDWAIGK